MAKKSADEAKDVQQEEKVIDFTKEVEVVSNVAFALDFGFTLKPKATLKVKVEPRFIEPLKNAVNLGYVAIK